jgi:chromosome segregation ATPase
MINLFIKIDPETKQQLDRIESLIFNLAERQHTMALDLTRLQAEIAENNSAIASAVTLLNQIADELRAQSGNQDAVNALADQLSGQSDALAAAVVANTPTQPQPEQPVE